MQRPCTFLFLKTQGRARCRAAAAAITATPCLPTYLIRSQFIAESIRQLLARCCQTRIDSEAAAAEYLTAYDGLFFRLLANSAFLPLRGSGRFVPLGGRLRRWRPSAPQCGGSTWLSTIGSSSPDGCRCCATRFWRCGRATMRLSTALSSGRCSSRKQLPSWRFYMDL